METFAFKVQVPVGIHVRNALLLSRFAVQYKSDITLCKELLKINAKNLMDIMILRIKCGDVVSFSIEGSDEIEAALKIREFCERNF